MESVQIHNEAAQALTNWKAGLAKKIHKQAKRIASEENSPNEISVAHYRQAALVALEELANEIKLVVDDGQRRAA